MYFPCRYLYQQGLRTVSLTACSFLEAYLIRNKTAYILDLQSEMMVNNGAISIYYSKTHQETPLPLHF
jgi:hypothetical protein